MSNIKKLMMSAAGGEALNVEDVFSTYLFNSSNSISPVTVTNGIDLSGSGGMVWVKSRNDGSGNGWPHITDTERGADKRLITSLTNASNDSATYQVVDQFNSDGFRYSDGNGSAYDYASWTFRKAPKFFDVVTWTGNGVAGRTISHSLGSEPGCIFVKRTNNNGSWNVYHRSLGNTKALVLNANDTPYTSAGFWNNTSPTSSVFSVGSSLGVNGNGDEYVAYIFAHNDGDGGFGINGDQDIIKCGSAPYQAATDVDLGFEPQWIFIKRTDSIGDWRMYDVGRHWGAINSKDNLELTANSANAETNKSSTYFYPTATGFHINTNYFGGGPYVYVAIRRGPMAVPESATDVFAIDTMGSTGDGKKPAFRSNKPVDLGIRYYAPSDGAPNIAVSRLTQGRVMLLPNNAAEDSNDNQFSFDYNNGWLAQTATISDYYSYMWSRAPNFFDVVCYSGNGTAGHTIDHNLGAVPEMMWVKKRNGADNWQVYLASEGADRYSPSFRTDPFYSTGTTRWNNTTPTATQFTLGYDNDVNASGSLYVAYLFASLDGISKIGTYTGTGSNINVNCGFSNGARFVFIKRTDAEIQSTTHWYAWDSLRGIISGNDPYMIFNDPQAQVTNTDYIDPLSSGFTVTSSANSGINASGGSYMFYAIA